jgi:hypothetical protein
MNSDARHIRESVRVSTPACDVRPLRSSVTDDPPEAGMWPQRRVGPGLDCEAIDRPRLNDHNHGLDIAITTQELVRTAPLLRPHPGGMAGERCSRHGSHYSPGAAGPDNDGTVLSPADQTRDSFCPE